MEEDLQWNMTFDGRQAGGRQMCTGRWAAPDASIINIVRFHLCGKSGLFIIMMFIEIKV